MPEKCVHTAYLGSGQPMAKCEVDAVPFSSYCAQHLVDYPGGHEWRLWVTKIIVELWNRDESRES